MAKGRVYGWKGVGVQQYLRVGKTRGVKAAAAGDYNKTQ